MSKKLCNVFLFVILLSCSISAQKKWVLPPAEFQQQISVDGSQVLDVRTPEEYAGSHITNSLQADWLVREQFINRVQYLDKSKPVYIYCESGGRSSEAGKWMRNNGFQNVFELQQGMIGWRKQNLLSESVARDTQMNMAEYDSILKASPVVLIDFGAKWCPPCKKMEPVVEELQRTLSAKFVFTKIDGGIHTDIMQSIKVEELPTFILYKDGKEKWRKTGLVTLEEFKTQIQ